MNRRRVLIETSWNVKQNNRSPRERACCINRNIVECKVHTKWLDPKSVIVLIETSWNVKSDMTLRKAPELQVLIETSWNVKSEHLSLRQQQVPY